MNYHEDENKDDLGTDYMDEATSLADSCSIAALLFDFSILVAVTKGGGFFLVAIFFGLLTLAKALKFHKFDNLGRVAPVKLAFLFLFSCLMAPLTGVPAILKKISAD